MEREERKMREKYQPGKAGLGTSMMDGNASVRLEGQRMGPDRSVLKVQKEINGMVSNGVGNGTADGQIGERRKENKKMK